MNCPFKIGEKIVCTKTIDHIHYWERDTGDMEIEILATCDKKYIVEDGYLHLTIKGDHGFSFEPNWNNFVTLKEYRKQKLIKLNQK